MNDDPWKELIGFLGILAILAIMALAFKAFEWLIDLDFDDVYDDVIARLRQRPRRKKSRRRG
jgi:hypothetical protein